MHVVKFVLAKAYDSIPPELAFGTLLRLGAPSRLVTATRAVYNTSKMNLRTREFHTEGMGATSGINQGCPIS